MGNGMLGTPIAVGASTRLAKARANGVIEIRMLPLRFEGLIPILAIGLVLVVSRLASPAVPRVAIASLVDGAVFEAHRLPLSRYPMGKPNSLFRYWIYSFSA